MTKQVKPKIIPLDADGSIWVGSLCRVDHSLGPDIKLGFFMSDELSYNRHSHEGATLAYLKGRGVTHFPSYTPVEETDVQFEKFVVEVQLNFHKGIHDQEVAVHGLGWINICSPTKNGGSLNGMNLRLEVFVARGAKVELRPSLLNHLEFGKRSVIQVKNRSIKKNY